MTETTYISQPHFLTPHASDLKDKKNCNIPNMEILPFILIVNITLITNKIPVRLINNS